MPSSVLIAATLWGVREGLRWTLLRELDKGLAEDEVEVRLTLERFYPDLGRIEDELNRKARSHKERSWYVRIFRANGGLIWSSEQAPICTYRWTRRWKTGRMTEKTFAFCSADSRWHGAGHGRARGGEPGCG